MQPKLRRRSAWILLFILTEIFPPEKSSPLFLFLAQRQKSEGKAWEKKGKKFSFLIEQQRRIMRTLLCLSWNVDCGWKREGNEARENVEHEYRLGWGRKIQRKDKEAREKDDAMPYLNFPPVIRPFTAAAACTFKTNIICSGLLSLYSLVLSIFRQIELQYICWKNKQPCCDSTTLCY